MNMPMKKPVIVSLLLIAAMLGLSAWAWQVTPAFIASHWGADGKPNGHMAKGMVLLLQPAIALGVTALFAFLPVIEPRRANLLASQKLYFSAWYGVVGLMAVVHAAIVLNAAGIHIDVPRWVMAAVGVLFMVLGNFLGKSHPTFFVGLRTPWSLSSNEAWEKSNRVAGYWLAATGLVTLPAALFGGTKEAVAILVAGSLLGVIAGTLTSYVTWKRDPHRTTREVAHE
jgi:uncharacterized membrane protein